MSQSSGMYESDSDRSIGVGSDPEVGWSGVDDRVVDKTPTSVGLVYGTLSSVL